MRDDLLKRHMNSKHSNNVSTQHHGQKRSQYMKLMMDSQYKTGNENESQADHYKAEELGNLLVSSEAKLKFELHRDNQGSCT